MLICYLNAIFYQVLWTDEKLFTVQAVHNHQNDRIWLPDIHMVPVECRSSFRRQKPASVMVWAGATSKGLKTPLIFIVRQELSVSTYRYRVIHRSVDKLKLIKTIIKTKACRTSHPNLDSLKRKLHRHGTKLTQKWCVPHVPRFCHNFGK